jgi:hypothetical protein
MGVPQRAFINDIKADLHDPDTVYVSLDNHKYGDYTPYLVKSNDRGRRLEVHQPATCPTATWCGAWCRIT